MMITRVSVCCGRVDSYFEVVTQIIFTFNCSQLLKYVALGVPAYCFLPSCIAAAVTHIDNKTISDDIYLTFPRKPKQKMCSQKLPPSTVAKTKIYMYIFLRRIA